MQRMYSVYKIQCLRNGRIYIGITSQTPEKRWRNGKKYSGDLLSDVKLFGWDSFSKSIIESGLSYENAAEREKFYIREYSKDFSLYNATVGGEVRSDEEIDKMSERLRGRKLPDSTKNRMSEARKGIVFSEQHKRNLSISHVGNPGFWEGKKRDYETNRKISQKLSIPIRCIETGEVFLNLKDAEEKTGYPMSCISKWCNGVHPRKCKYTFEKVV